MSRDPAFKLIGEWRTPGSYRGALAMPVDASGRLLMQCRDDIEGIIAPGKWGLFGGGIEAGEDARTAVAREFEEETGLDYAPERFRPAYQVLTGSPRWGLLSLFAVELTDPVSAIRTYEGAGFACCTRSQVEKLDVIAYLRPAIADFWDHAA